MNGFGEALRKERESRGVALDVITKITKISNRHLIALEQEQFKALPGGVFNKSIVRGYARVVGLDEEEWVERYLSAYQSSGIAPPEEAGWAQFAENASKARESAQGRRPEMRLRWAGIVILLLVLAAVSWFAWGYAHKKSASAQPAVHPAAAQPAADLGRRSPRAAVRVRPPLRLSDTLGEVERRRLRREPTEQGGTAVLRNPREKPGGNYIAGTR